VRLTTLLAIILVTVLGPATTVRAQDMPAEYQAVLSSLNKKGDLKDGVLKVNIPRADLHVTIGGRPAPTITRAFSKTVTACDWPERTPTAVSVVRIAADRMRFIGGSLPQRATARG